MARLEDAVANSGNLAFSIAFSSGFPAEILSGNNPFSNSDRVVLGDVIHPDDYQPFCEIVNEIVNGRSEELKAHARILTENEYRWYYISAAAQRGVNNTLKEIVGMMFDVSEYLDCDCDDTVMQVYRRKSRASMANAQEVLSIVDILGVDYLARIQKPFSGIKGLYSAITDGSGNVITIPSGQDRRINLNKIDFQRKKSIIVNHSAIASWIIAGDNQEVVDNNAQLLSTMVETVSGIANSYVVLGGAMDDSQNANRLLGQNFEDSILINNIYSIILESSDTKSAIGSIIPLISSYFSLSDIMYCSEESSPATVYHWDSSGMLLPVVGIAPDTSEIDRELDYREVVCSDEKQLKFDRGENRSCALSCIYRSGKRKGIIVFVSEKSGRSWSNRDRRQLKNLTQIFSTVIYKAFTEAELTASQERLLKLAYYDLTTNIPNRSMFERDFEKELDGVSGAVIAVEITSMKSISEIYSCEYADNILKSAAEYIAAIPCSSEKKVYRFSNDILLVNMKGSSREEARQLAQALLTKFSSPWYLNDTEHHLEVYAGVTSYPCDADNLSDIVRAATQTLRLAKERKYCDAACYSEGLEEQLNDNRQVKKLIMDSAENDFRGFYFLYQPVLDVRTGGLHCCEAALYWGNEDMIVPRERYLPIIERMGMGIKLFGFAVNRMCEFCAEVRKNGVKHFRVSFAIPESIISNDVCIESISAALLQYSLPPNAISIAISESARTLNTENFILKQLSKIGVNIIAEDTGDRFFTTERIENDVVKTIKIRSSRFTDDQVSGAFIRSVTKKAHERGIGVCVKGVDNAEILEKVRKFDIDLVEGIFNGRPLHSSEFIEKILMKESIG